jgi:signal transduction histidine kinase/ligand-binding sensor domain-containing protein
MRFAIALIFIFFFFKAVAQLPQEIKFANYTRANGLPEESVTNITQDSRGFLWIGSREGLFRFDGRNYKAWYADPTDSTRFSNNSISVLGEYKRGQLLFISGGKIWTIDIYNHAIVQVNSCKNKSIITTPTRIANNQWLVTDLDSIYVTDDDFNIRSSISLRKYFPAVLVAAFYLEDPWVLLYANGIQNYYLLNYKDGSVKPFPVEDNVLDTRSKFYVPTAYDSVINRLYLSSYFNGNSYIDINSDQVGKYQPIPISAQRDGAIRKTILLPEKKMMIQAGINGLYFTDFNKTTYFNSSSQDDKPLVSDILLDIYRSRENDYWLSTLNGISRFTLSPPLIKYWKQPGSSKAQDEIKRIFKGSDNNIYFLKQATSLYQLDKHTWQAKRLDSSIGYCWSAIPVGNNILFTGDGKKIGIYDITKNRTYYPDFLKPYYSANTDLVTLVYRARNQDMWYSCNGSVGIIRNPSGTNDFFHYTRNSSPPPFSHSYVHCVAEDSQGNIWWASNKTQMLLKWDASKQKFFEFAIDELIPQNKLKTGVNNLYIDGKDNLWIAMDAAALLKYNLNTHTGNYYDINKGLPTDAVFGMCSDAKDRLWFSTRKGLCCYLPDKDKVITFTNSDGLPEDNFEDDGIYYDKDEQMMYVGGHRTIAYFNPDTLLIKSISDLPAVYIDEMLVNGKIFFFNDEKKIRLRTKENNLEFGFSAPDFNRNNQLIFQYRLQGISDDWINMGDKRSVVFNGLRYGTYTLSVRCAYKGTESWNETRQPFTFTIQTPLIQQIWFRILLGLLAAFLVALFIRNYYRRKLQNERSTAEKIQAVEKERTRIATDMHDDFGANLSRIKFISEKMQLTQSGNAQLTKDLTKISDYSDEMAEKMNEIVWALNQRYDSVADLVSFCRSYASEFLQDKNIHFAFFSNDVPDKMIQGESRRNIFLVIKEALHNLAKHSQATESRLIFHFSIDQVKVEIIDNGKGFSKESIRPFANGLENMKKRIENVGGNLIIESAPGTHIRISVPI